MLARLKQSLLDHFVLRPTRHPIDSTGARREYAELSKGKIEFFVQHHGMSKAPTELLVLKFPGTAGRAERSSLFPGSCITEIHTKIWTWNPPGYGQSEGKSTLPVIANSALDFFNYALSEHDQDLPIWLVGNSLGCLSALHIASAIDQNHYRLGVILRNPPDLIRVVKNVARKYPFGFALDGVAESLCDAMNVRLTAPRCTAPAFFLQSEFDTLVPRRLQDQIIELYGGDYRKLVLSGLEHDGKLQPMHYPSINSGIQWLWSQTNQDKF